MKINTRADYHVEDWGLTLDWSHDEFKKHTKSNFPVRTADDWLKIKALSPTAPALAEHLKVVSLIRKQSDKELPILMTVFTPSSLNYATPEPTACFSPRLSGPRKTRSPGRNTRSSGCRMIWK